MRRLLPALAGLAIALGPGATSLPAQELGLSGLGTLKAGWGTVLNEQNQELDRLYREAMLDLDLSWRSLRLNAAAAALHPAELPDARPEATRIKDADLIRRSLEWQGPVHVQLGHFWTTFGNGLALSLYRDDALENPRLTGTARQELPTTWDSRGDGALVEALHGDWTLKALAGGHDYVGRLGAANLEWHRPWGSLGGSWVRAAEIPESIQDLQPRELDLESRELYATVRLGRVELSLNHVDQHQHDELPVNAGSGGLATYGTASLPLLGWQVLAEYKYYRFARRALYINNPPIVQKEIPTRLIARKRRLNTFENETGLQLDLSRPLAAGQTLLLSGAWTSRIEDNLLPRFEEALSAYQEYTAGWLLDFDHDRQLALGAAYAEETSGFVEGGAPLAGRPWYRRTGLTAGWHAPLPLVNSLELAGEFMRKEERARDKTSDAVLLWANFYPAKPLSVNVTADYEEHSESGRDWLASGELRMDLRHRDLSHTLTLFAGRQRGGLVCSSGNCRVVAPFDGVKATLATQF
ncbi:MAG: hypothetical protein Q8O14_09625 [bacterium]|jgi:hypothetical protein|nr:hypothetical protein [bacterium]